MNCRILRILLIAAAMILARAGSVEAVENSSADGPFILRTFIPSSNNVHGEVRLIRRGDIACVQTLLYSKFLRRGLYEMEKEERRCWGEDGAGFSDSANYVADMHIARDIVLGESTNLPPDETASADPRKKMMIEFSLGPGSAAYALSKIELDGPADALRIAKAAPLASRTATPYYISRAMQLMMLKAFGLPASQTDDLLKQAGWREVEPPPLTPSQMPVTK